MGDLMINTTVHNSRANQFEFKLFVSTRGTTPETRIVNLNAVTFSIKVGCFQEKYLTAIAKNLITEPHFVSFENGVLTFIYPVPSKIQSHTIDLGAILYFQTDVPGCGAYSVASFSDSTFGTLTSVNSTLRLQQNPSFKDSISNTLSTILVIEMKAHSSQP